MEVSAVDSGNRRASFVDDFGRAVLDEVKLEIGAVPYVRLYPEHQHAKEEINCLRERQYGALTGKVGSEEALKDLGEGKQVYYVPLDFWWANDYGDALPLVGMHLSDVKIQIKTKAKADLIKIYDVAYTVAADTGAEITEMHLVLEYVYLDDLERDWFAETPLKYLITQNQSIGTTTFLSGATTGRIDLNFNHPTKKLMVLQRKSSATTALNYFDFSGLEVAPYATDAFATMSFKLNGNDRVEARDPLYFRIVQNIQHHAR
jgi:hypothetical protein